VTWGSGSYRWGSFRWGDVDVEDMPSVFVDGNATKADVDVEWLVDALALFPDRERTVSADGLGEATTDVGFAVDAYTQRITAGWAKQATMPLVLVELRLTGGTIRVAARDVTVGGYGWAGRLVESGRILRTIGDGTEDMSIELDDTSTRGSRFRDLFRANAPEGRGVSVYIALDGDGPADVMHVWEGRIERVAAFSRATVRIEALRPETVEDRLLGRAITTDDFPDAPPESVGRMVPIVFGTVEAHEGVVTNTQALGQLAQNVFAADVVIKLRDASTFPASGVLQVGAERMAWSSKSGNILQAVHRGFDGTSATDHSKGDDVIEVGTFEVTLADHALSRIENVRIQDSTGELGEPVPLPTTIDHANGRLRWDSIPRIRSKAAEPVYSRVHFDGPGTGNLAANPDYAARESPGYDALGYADLSLGKLVLHTNAEGLGQPGDIQAVWLAVIFDPDSIANSGAVARLPTGQLHSLRPFDDVPDEIARHDERTGDRIYEVTSEPFDVDLGEETDVLQPNEVIHPGFWGFDAMAEKAVDGDEDTFAAYAFISAGEAQIVGSPIVRYRLAPGPDYTGSEVTECRLVVVAGWQYTPFTSPFKVRLAKRKADGSFAIIPGAEVTCNSLNPAGTPAGFIKGIDTFEVSIDPALLGSGLLLEDMADVEWQVVPVLGVSNGLWVGREIRMEVKTTRSASADANVDPNRTVTNYFEVSAAGFASRSQAITGAATAYDWGFFSDAARGGSVEIETNVLSHPARIVEVFWVVKHAPFEDARTTVPRVFADVAGRVPAGNPVDVMESIVTTAAPAGMGLSASDRIARDAYMSARASAVEDGLRVDFALRERLGAVAVLRAIADQADMRQGWDRGRHQVVRKPRADTSAAVRLTIVEHDAWKGALRPTRTPLGEVRTRIVGLFAPYAPTGQPSASASVVDPTAETEFGRIEEERTLDLVRDAATATLALTRDLERRSQPRWVIDFELPPMGLELRHGDLIAFDHHDFACAVAEVLDLHLETRAPLRLVVRAVVWLLE